MGLQRTTSSTSTESPVELGPRSATIRHSMGRKGATLLVPTPVVSLSRPRALSSFFYSLPLVPSVTLPGNRGLLGGSGGLSNSVRSFQSSAHTCAVTPWINSSPERTSGRCCFINLTKIYIWTDETRGLYNWPLRSVVCFSWLAVFCMFASILVTPVPQISVFNSDIEFIEVSIFLSALIIVSR